MTIFDFRSILDVFRHDVIIVTSSLFTLVTGYCVPWLHVKPTRNGVDNSIFRRGCTRYLRQSLLHILQICSPYNVCFLEVIAWAFDQKSFLLYWNENPICVNNAYQGDWKFFPSIPILEKIFCPEIHEHYTIVKLATF